MNLNKKGKLTIIASEINTKKTKLDSISNWKLYKFMEQLNYLECDGKIYKNRYHKDDLNKFIIEEIVFEDFNKMCNDWHNAVNESIDHPLYMKLIKVV